jgi:hypothetical protein
LQILGILSNLRPSKDCVTLTEINNSRLTTVQGENKKSVLLTDGFQVNTLATGRTPDFFVLAEIHFTKSDVN